MFLFVDKPVGISSHGVVDTIRRLTGEKKVGHSGTLDPLASGLLIVAVGRIFTKRLHELLTIAAKTYTAEITLGEERTTDDSEGEVVSENTNLKPPLLAVQKVISSFHGELLQLPPQFSAVKLQGKKAYELARAGKLAVLKPRKITVYKITLLSYQYPFLKFEAEVSKGTYIRSLARDIGRTLGTGAYVSALRRSRIGKYSVNDATPLNDITPQNVKQIEREL